MAKFLNTSATNYYLEELIKGASDRLILISPFLKLNDRIKELLEDKNRLKIDVRIVYGKSELQPKEINWLKELTFVRTSFCKNLHAKCYLNEESCIVTSLNLYEFSQVNNNEMGVFISRSGDPNIYKDAYEEAQRIIRISDEIRISLETVVKAPEEEKVEGAPAVNPGVLIEDFPENSAKKVTSSKLAQMHRVKTPDFVEKLISLDYLALIEGQQKLTEKGKEAGGEFRNGKFTPYFLWA